MRGPRERARSGSTRRATSSGRVRRGAAARPQDGPEKDDRLLRGPGTARPADHPRSHAAAPMRRAGRWRAPTATATTPTRIRRTGLETIIRETVEQGGTLLIPAFAVGRTQALLFLLRELQDEDRLPRDIPIHVDSPMAIHAIRVFMQHGRLTDWRCARWWPTARIRSGCSAVHLDSTRRAVQGAQRSDAIRRSSSPPRAWRPAAGSCTTWPTVCPTTARPCCSPGTRRPAPAAARSRRGPSTIRIHGREIPVRARIETLHGLSAHADRDGDPATGSRRPTRRPAADLPGPRRARGQRGVRRADPREDRDRGRRSPSIWRRWSSDAALRQDAAGHRAAGRGRAGGASTTASTCGRCARDGKLRAAGEFGNGDGFLEIFEAQDRLEAGADRAVEPAGRGRPGDLDAAGVDRARPLTVGPGEHARTGETWVGGPARPRGPSFRDLLAPGLWERGQGLALQHSTGRMLQCKT